LPDFYWKIPFLGYWSVLKLKNSKLIAAQDYASGYYGYDGSGYESVVAVSGACRRKFLVFLETP
jgi:hypothetical protein